MRKKGGYGIVFQTVMRNKNLSPEAKAIYAYLCSFAGNGETCYPSAEMMRNELNMGENRFSKYMRELIACGVVERTRRASGNLLSGNIYRITHDVNLVENRKFGDIENRGIENVNVEIGGIENRGPNSNSLNSNSFKNNSIDNIISSEPEESAPNGSGILLPLIDKTFYDVPVDKISKWQQAFPGVDVELELRRMITWCDANPKKKKTRRGADKFINGWLERAQNRGSNYTSRMQVGEEVGDNADRRPASDFYKQFVPGAGDSNGD